MAILFLDFFGSDLSKMDQTCKFGKQTSRFLCTIKYDFQIKLTLVTKVLVLIYISGAVIKLMHRISKCTAIKPEILIRLSPNT
jgi:hypothetical protein